MIGHVDKASKIDAYDGFFGLHHQADGVESNPHRKIEAFHTLFMFINVEDYLTSTQKRPRNRLLVPKGERS